MLPCSHRLTIAATCCQIIPSPFLDVIQDMYWTTHIKVGGVLRNSVKLSGPESSLRGFSPFLHGDNGSKAPSWVQTPNGGRTQEDTVSEEKHDLPRQEASDPNGSRPPTTRSNPHARGRRGRLPRVRRIGAPS